MKSELGRGTRFEILLPAVDPGGEDTGNIQPTQEVAMMTLNARILVMDDDKIVRDISKKMLQKLGCSVDLAYDGMEAIDKYTRALNNKKPFDVVIMDLTIPGGMGGKDAVRELLKIDPDATAIVASGYSTDPVMSNFKKFGFKGLVTKPYRILELQEALDAVLAD